MHLKVSSIKKIIDRSQENHFYFVVLDLNHDDEQDIVMSTRLQKMIRPFITSLESALSSIKLGVNTVKLTPSFGYIDSTTSDMSSHYLIKAALQASQNQNPHFSVIDISASFGSIETNNTISLNRNSRGIH